MQTVAIGKDCCRSEAGQLADARAETKTGTYAYFTRCLLAARLLAPDQPQLNKSMGSSTS